MVVTLYGCNNNSPLFYRYVFTDSIAVTASRTVDLADYGVLKSFDLIRYKGWTFFREVQSTHNVIKAVNPDFSKSVGLLNIGNGPTDLSRYSDFFINNDSLFIMDPNLRKILSVEIQNDSIVVKPYRLFNGMATTFIPIGNQHFFAIDLMDSVFFRIVDFDNNVYYRYPLPYDESLSVLDNWAQLTFYSKSKFTTSPSDGKIAFAVTDMGMYGFGRIHSNDSVSFFKIINYYTLTDFDLKEGYVVPCDSNIDNVLASTSSDDFVFFLHSGNERSKTFQSVFSHRILIYTWDGDPYKILTFNDNLNLESIRYDAGRNVLYGIAFNPECQYVEIDLNSIL